MNQGDADSVSLSIPSVFLEQVQRRPASVCLKIPGLSTPGWALTYRELDDWSNALANRLMAQGVAPGDRVGVLAERCPAAVAALLAIVKAGASYVPLNPEYPQSRIDLMVEDSDLGVVVADADYALLPASVTVLSLEEKPSPAVRGECLSGRVQAAGDDPAYILYTSGSTGRPKGVIVPHRAILRLVSPQNHYCRFDEQQCFLQLAPLSFDAATFEIWGALLNGGCCTVMPGAAMPGLEQFGRVLASGVTNLWLTASLYNTVISEAPHILRPVKRLLIGGEALSVAHVRKGLQALPDTQIINGYGPTENTTFTTAYPIPRELPRDLRRIPIGYPIFGTECAVVDADLKPVPDGEEGELIAFGQGLALGYLKRAELTAERFIDVQCGDGVTRRGYRTGDIVVRRADGAYDYLGRNDKQVKIDGHRIEPQEIERFLNELDAVDEARVVVKTGPQGQRRLAAYFVSRDGSLDGALLRGHLSAEFPRYMVPHFIIPVPELPKNPNGKLDEARLPDPFAERRQVLAGAADIAACWRAILGRGVADSDNFIDAGGTSLEALRLAELLEKQFDCELEATFVFAYPTIRAQADYFAVGDTPPTAAPRAYSAPAGECGNADIAVIGMACRFPGAENLEQYWDNLVNGRETVRFFSDDELSPDVDDSERRHPNYVRAKGIIDGCEYFDAAFFGVSPAEADIMDPQQRIMLELAWHALEDAGCVPGERAPRTGVFAGMNWGRYFQQNILNNADVRRRFGLFNAALANESDFLSSRISYKLDLTGPSVNVYTACSTGLVAIAQACGSIQRGDCDMALAGGVSVSTPVRAGYVYQEGSMLSRDGHCRPFDVDATGTTFNDGAGFVVLKRLDLALRDGDNIYATVKGFAVNNDGSNKASFTAPSVHGQVDVYRAALANAGVPADSIGFIETHGTATPLGDPIEVSALNRVYGGDAAQPGRCAIGSVKSNIGHTIHAAGIASFIKTAMAVSRGLIPATLYFRRPNPKLGLENSPFYVNPQSVAWTGEAPRRAAVSSLGVGGTNAHVIVEQFDGRAGADTRPAAAAPGGGRMFALLLSAKTEQSLADLAERYRHYFDRHQQDLAVADIAYTSLVARRHFRHRAVVTGSSAADLAVRLADKKQCLRGAAHTAADAAIGFLFTGQGSQRLAMGRALYADDPGFRGDIDTGSEAILARQGFDPRAYIRGDKPLADAQVNRTAVAQPLLYLFEYALARYLLRRGCRPDFLIGHSVGEFAAAALAGVFSFEDGAGLVAARGALMQAMPAGRMLAVKAGPDEIEHLLSEHLCLAAVNAPDRLVLAGPESAVQAAAETLAAAKVASSVLHTSHAFHSSMMDPVTGDIEALLQTVAFDKPSLPIFSTSTGALLTDGEAMDPAYWSAQLRRPVRFAEAVGAARDYYADRALAFVEVGPGSALTSLVAGQNTEAKNTVLAAAPGCAVDSDYRRDIERCLGGLWTAGFNIDWMRQFQDTPVKKIRLPGYAFKRENHWISAPARVDQAGPATGATGSVPPPATPTLREVTMNSEQHRNTVEQKLRALLEDVTGFDLGDVDANAHFSELGLDSLLLTQAATTIDQAFSIGLTFRHLVESCTTINELTDFVAAKVPPQTVTVTETESASHPAIGMTAAGLQAFAAGAVGDDVRQLIQQQLGIMQMQLQVLGGASSAVSGATAPAVTGEAQVGSGDGSVDEKQQGGKTVRHTPGTRITREILGVDLTKAQRQWIDEQLEAYQKKYAGSKQYTQQHRKYLADPRTVSGFNPEWKEIVFPIVVERSKGSKLWDIDGNELIDTSNGFGPIFFGHSPDFLQEAVRQQMEKGIETGPQSPLAGEVAKLFCELTGNERCTFACTGSEAVVGALRLARTVTGRQKVVVFEGSYHGITDEVINRPGRDYQALPAAPGIPREATANVLVLPWAERESLDVIESLGKDLAAVLVEPVQSRKPEFHDKDYLQRIRAITEACGAAMILDEVVTGFRVAPGGIRQRFDIDADLATYGKVVAGGYPIGIIGGKAKFMDALDGGYWQFGDDSIPEVGVTFFAGTFVRHPLALAAARAVMQRIREGGAALYTALEDKTSAMTSEAKAFIEEMKCEVKFDSFASFFYVAVPASAHWGHLLFTLMTLEGIHIQQYRPNFLTTEHSQTDVDRILNAFKKSLAQLICHGLIEGDMVAAKRFLNEKPAIPKGARLGKNARGEPAYFIEDPNNKGQYIEVGKP